jgi:hypothetical protein
VQVKKPGKKQAFTEIVTNISDYPMEKVRRGGRVGRNSGKTASIWPF